ncbi:MAG: alpha-L-fucosidase [Phycisphaerae bacterium]
MRLRIAIQLLLSALLPCASCLAQGVAPPPPHGACPSPVQLAWHDLEFYGFIHFTTNTFTDREWGLGDESPAIFNPTALDTTQWARVARDAGMRGLILTAKHHDGFCLWPSKHTEHSVKASPWKNGNGDVIGEFVAACRAADLKVGLYLSPWDRNHAEYGRPAYVQYYRAQWRELIQTYGPLFEVWQDGANGGDGYYGGARDSRIIDRQSYYGWAETNAQLLKLDQSIIIFSDAGPGCRWVGNEAGHSDRESWQTINLVGMYPGVSHDHLARGDKNGTHWVGVEVDVSIRPGWFYHAAEDANVKTGAQLVEIWYNSVGRGANLLLNVPPDRRGLIHNKDIASLRDMRRTLDATFANDLARGKPATGPARGDDKRFAPTALTDGDPATFWALDDGTTSGAADIDLGAPVTFDVIRLREHVALGQRVEKFAIDVRADGKWREIAAETTIGPRRILRVEPLTADAVRLRIVESLACPSISELSLFKQPTP